MDTSSHHNAYAFKKIIFRYLLAGMLLLAVIFLGSVLWSYQQQDEIRHINWEESVKGTFEQRIWGVGKNIEALLYVLAENPLLCRHYLAGDRAGLLKTAQDIERHFSQDQQITHFYFHDLDRVNFLRVHQPERYGDTINRITMHQAVNSGTIAAGLELGPLGTLTMRVVMPWYEGGRLIGYLELGRELSTMISVLKQLNLVDGCLLTVKKKYIDRKGWENGMAMLQRPADWSVFADRVVMVNMLPEKIDVNVSNHGGSNAFELLYAKDTKGYMVSHQQITDASGQLIGQLLCVRDESASLQIARQQLLFFLLIMAGLTALLLTQFYRVLSKVEERLIESGRELGQRVDDRTRELQDEVSHHQETSHKLEQQRQLQESLVLSRTRVLDAVAYSAKSFLNQGDWQKQLPAVLERLGKAVDASRVTLYQNSWTEDGELLVSLAEAWIAKDVPNIEDIRPMQNVPAHKVGFERWEKSLLKGEPVHGSVVTFPETEQKFLQQLSIKSILVEPVFVNRKWWGFISFSDCLEPRQWSTAEVDGLYTVAEALGATIQQQQQEETLRTAKQAAEVANIAKSDFLANMSHEIRTPMNSIVGFVDVVLQEDINPNVRRKLDSVKKASADLMGILNDILDFSTIDSCSMSIKTIDFNLLDITSSLGNMLQEKTAERGNLMVFNIDEDVPDGLIGDPLHLGQIMKNLLDNGIKFTRDGEIVVRVRCLNNEVNADGKETVVLQFTVQDNGIGIAPEKLDRVFDTFTQADGSTTREFGGTGLGLTISRKLVELLGGELEVVSSPGKGSTFSFTVPFGVRVGQETDSLRNKNFQNKKILVVDDDTALLTILEIMLHRLGFEVETAARPSIAMKKLQESIRMEKPFDLVLLDFLMPEQDGITMANEIRNNPLLADTPMIMLTGYGADLEQQRAKEAKINGFLKKPVTKDVLFETIQMALRHGQDNHNVAPGQKTIDHDLFKEYKVLLVDDNELNRILVKEILENAGLYVEIANSGKAALELLLHLDVTFNAILMEAQMPELNGLTISSLIRQCEAGELPETGEHEELLLLLSAKIYGTHIPIVAMTDNGMDSDRENCLKAEIDECIVKPFVQEDVLETLLRVADAVG